MHKTKMPYASLIYYSNYAIKHYFAYMKARLLTTLFILALLGHSVGQNQHALPVEITGLQGMIADGFTKHIDQITGRLENAPDYAYPKKLVIDYRNSIGTITLFFDYDPRLFLGAESAKTPGNTFYMNQVANYFAILSLYQQSVLVDLRLEEIKELERSIVILKPNKDYMAFYSGADGMYSYIDFKNQGSYFEAQPSNEQLFHDGIYKLNPLINIAGEKTSDFFLWEWLGIDSITTDNLQTRWASENSSSSTDLDIENNPATEKAAIFPGGNEALVKYFETNIQYPTRLKKMGVNGTVYVGFIVDEYGNVHSPKVIRGIAVDCDQEAIRLVSSMPKWVAAVRDGMPIATYNQLSIKFKK
jgi:TonB family protein